MCNIKMIAIFVIEITKIDWAEASTVVLLKKTHILRSCSKICSFLNQQTTLWLVHFKTDFKNTSHKQFRHV